MRLPLSFDLATAAASAKATAASVAAALTPGKGKKGEGDPATEPPGDSFSPGGAVIDTVKGFAGRVLKGLSDNREPSYKEGPGPFKVSESVKTYTDKTRGRSIPMAMYYPKGQTEPDSSPVVVMSHGLGGNIATYRYLGQHLASHGYTVLQPTHEGSDTGAVLTRTPVFTFHQGELKERVADLKFALDLVEDKKLPKALTDSADLDNVAVAGHSFGALTAQAMAGVTVRDGKGDKVPLEDKRVDAFIAMSPYGDSLPSHLLGMDVDSYKEIDKPILYLSGDKDNLFTLGRGATAHSTPFQGTVGEDNYHVVIGGTRHIEFAQVLGLFDPRTVEMTETTSTAFLDAHLKDDAKAEQYLTEQLPAVARTRDSWAFIGS